MSFNIERQSDSRKVKTNGIDVQGSDNISFSRDAFHSNPDTEQDPGMDFLVDNSDDDQEDQELNEQDEQDYDQPEPNGEFSQNPEYYQDTPQKSYEEIQQEKSYFLSQLKRLEKKGNVVSRRFTMEHSLDEIRGEVIRIKKEQDMDNSIDYLRQGLMFCVSSIEMADGKYNMGGSLGGWSQAVFQNIDSYDSVFEELYDKYSTSMHVMPEIKLISMLAGSAFMFSLQKKMVGGGSSTANSSGGPAPRQREMSGPSINTDALMQSLNDLDLDDISSVASSNDSVKITTEEPKKTIDVGVKKTRGRPKKN